MEHLNQNWSHLRVQETKDMTEEQPIFFHLKGFLMRLEIEMPVSHLVLQHDDLMTEMYECYISESDFPHRKLLLFLAKEHRRRVRFSTLPGLCKIQAPLYMHFGKVDRKKGDFVKLNHSVALSPIRDFVNQWTFRVWCIEMELGSLKRQMQSLQEDQVRLQQKRKRRDPPRSARIVVEVHCPHGTKAIGSPPVRPMEFSAPPPVDRPFPGRCSPCEPTSEPENDATLPVLQRLATLGLPDEK